MKMRNRSIALLLAFAMIFSVFTSRLIAYAAEERGNSVVTENTQQGYPMETEGVKPSLTSGEQTMETHSFKWLSGSTSTVIEGTKLMIAPDKNGRNTSSVTAQLNFSFGGEKNMPAGAITIRLPRHIFYNRKGDPVGTVAIPLAKAPAAEGVTGFHYSFDEETDEIILTNFTEIPASYFFNCQIAYKFTPYNIKDGYTNNNIEATFEVKMPDEGEPIKKRSKPLSVQVETIVPKPSAAKSFETKYEKWQSAWGEKPSDSEDYFYVVWRLHTSIGSTGTQPYKVTYEENPDAIGEIIGWYEGSASSRFTAGDKDALERHVFSIENDTSTSSSNRHRYDYVVAKYPREAAAAQKHKVTNEYKAVVTGIDGEQKKSGHSASYTYTKVDFEYQGDRFSVNKSVSSNRSGGINELESGLDTNTTSPFHLQVSNRGYGLTNKGTTPYTTYLEDKQLYIQNERLIPGDYSFTKFSMGSLDEYGFIIDDEKGYVRTLNKDYASYQPVEVYVRTENNRKWKKLGIIQKVNSSSYRWTDSDGNDTQHSNASQVILPAGTWDISFRHTGSQYEVFYSVHLYTQLHPSEHILSLLKGKNGITCYNICSGYATDAQGTIRTGSTPPTLSTTIKNEVTQADIEEFGQIVAHSYTTASLTRWSTSGVVDKSANSPVSDPIKGQESVSYTLKQYDYLNLSNSSQKQAAIESGVITEHRDGVFYDLLPAGTSVDVNSVYARTYYSNIPCSYSLSFEENWKNSGRTMMIVNVNAPENTENFHWNGSAVYSGFYVVFTLINTWENIQDYGATIRNSMAYYSNDGNLARGFADNGGTFSDKDWFYDLDGDGNNDSTKKNVVYDDILTTFSPLTASELGFRKAVKTPQDTTYEVKAEAMASGEYTYQLRFGNGAAVNTKDVVIYDVLETARPNNAAYWKGKLKNINTTQVQNKGIDVKIYYSTSDAFGKITTGSAWSDLNNGNLWSQTAPSDLSDVTAIAIDMSRKTDGSEYVFTPQEVALCYVTMTAPSDVDEYIDRPDTPENESVYAYNSAYLRTTSIPVAGGVESTAIEECSRVQVSVRDADVEIHKSADPKSGNKKAPVLVEAGGTIAYSVDVTNKETVETIHNIVIEDEVPAGLIVDTGSIKCYFGDAASKAESISTSTRVKMVAEGQKLTFTVDKLAGGETVHLLIPTRVRKGAVAGRVFENTAKITGFNNKKKTIGSERTWHKTDPETVDVTVNKTWEDRDDAYHTRPESVEVQLYADGVALAGKAIELNAANNWSYQFTDLPKYQNDGTVAIRYTIKEKTILGEYDATYSPDGKTVINTLKTSSGNVGTTLTVQKYRNGTKLPVAGAVFHLKDSQGEIVSTARTDTKGVADFVITPPSNADSYELFLVEGSAPAGYIAGTDMWRVKFTKGDMPTIKWNLEKKVLETTWIWKSEVFQEERTCKEYRDGVLKVYNDYNASGQLQLTASKQLAGRALAEGEFHFVVKDERNKQVAKGTNAADGTVLFSAIEYDVKDVGKHIYTISEVKGNTSHVTYDETTFVIPVDVTDNGDGTLTATPYYPEGGAAFRNIYSPPSGGGHDWASAKVKISARKTLDGVAPEGSQFTFLLRDANGKVLQAVRNNGGSVTFNSLEYMKAGTYTYTLVEQIGSDSRIRYDSSVYTITVQVVKSDDYEATVSYQLNGQECTGLPVFKNTTKARGNQCVQVSVRKVWNDKDSAKRPVFITAQLYKNGRPYGDSVVLRAKNDWCYTWDNLDKAAIWTVDEIKVPRGYEKSVMRRGNSWTITNTNLDNSKTANKLVPQTGDYSGITAWMMILLSSLAGVACLLGVKNRRRKQKKN